MLTKTKKMGLRKLAIYQNQKMGLRNVLKRIKEFKKIYHIDHNQKNRFKVMCVSDSVRVYTYV